MLPPSVGYAKFYQQLFSGVGSYQQLGDRLIQLAEQAHAFRRFDSLKEYGQLLSNTALNNYQAAGLYYQAIATNRIGHGDQEKARKLFERVADVAPQKYRAKAILSLAAVSSQARDYQSQFGFLLESAKASCDISTKVRAHLGLAIYKSMEGFNSSALNDFESLYALARYAQPVVYFDYLNSYAVVLGEVGRKQEARNISRIVLATPFAHAYPEWQETARDLKVPDRSFVAFEPTPNDPRNVVNMPVAQQGKGEQVRYDQPARVLNIQQWKTKMDEARKPSEAQKILEIVNRIILFYTSKDTTDAQRYDLWEAVQKVIHPPGPDETMGA
jgi:tetratricopeptide (TPR) repeat protein